MAITQLPRTFVRTGLRAARLPISMAEVALGRGDDWSPARRFDSAAGSVKLLAGALLHDDVLVEEGRLDVERVTELERAAALEAEAARRRSLADTQLGERREHDATRREAADERAEQRVTQLEHERAERERAAERAAAAREQELREREAEAERALSAEEREARRTRLAAERAALGAERDAVEAKEEAADVEGVLDVAQAARKAERAV
jgi:hypothetical protein